MFVIPEIRIPRQLLGAGIETLDYSFLCYGSFFFRFAFCLLNYGEKNINEIRFKKDAPFQKEKRRERRNLTRSNLYFLVVVVLLFFCCCCYCRACLHMQKKRKKEREKKKKSEKNDFFLEKGFLASF